MDAFGGEDRETKEDVLKSMTSEFIHELLAGEMLSL